MIRVYLKEKKLLLEVMKQGDEGMRKLAFDALKQAWLEVYGTEVYIGIPHESTAN